MPVMNSASLIFSKDERMFESKKGTGTEKYFGSRPFNF